ncbi:hypothetical protein CN327_06645 [Bacillus cereus]|uniref:hypothetical protein n=1 Tax=Bacillus nitratireducens TaxID=2026193 RepID=UPI000BEB94D2|nr:hypothetical protein [Bacillus nitratireducens]PEE16629.1 hypothetical protein CON53_16865 [Bacillus cereus]MED0904256.1 hypothetical protein [Bacillus nitratireducens]PES82104.1 hypothetical protein CN509_06745 [Bacillus cereus]PET10930.1 hypothetical protein CN505_01455 [Bacillus cereus]PFF35965.1 hypothetical protein CN327_06645 [Bacillus cereus]
MPPTNGGFPLPTTVAPCSSISGIAIFCFLVRGAVGEPFASTILISSKSLFAPRKSSLVFVPVLLVFKVICSTTVSTSFEKSLYTSFSNALPVA